MAKSKSSSKRVGESMDMAGDQVGAVYARALLGAAESAGKTDAIVEELDSLLDDVLAVYPDFERVLTSGLVTPADKVALLDRALASRASPLMLNFLKVVATHGRLGALRGVRRELHKQVDELRGRFRVEVATAVALDDSLAAKLVEKLRGMLAGEPQLVSVTDPDLIGGLVLRVGDTVYDGSVANHLARVRAQMINRSVNEIQRRRNRFSAPTGN
jgi:F-type H+-transporting ATPase subunit delta